MLERTIDEIRPYYHHVGSCQETVPEAITAFMEGTDFEDVIRTAVSLGGDCDTLTDIAAAMAEAFYGIPAILRAEVRNRVKPDMLEVLDRFDKLLNRPGDDEMHDSFLDGNEKIDQAISRLAVEGTREAMVTVLDTIHNRMLQNGHFLLPTRMKFDVNGRRRWTRTGGDGGWNLIDWSMCMILSRSLRPTFDRQIIIHGKRGKKHCLLR